MKSQKNYLHLGVWAVAFFRPLFFLSILIAIPYLNSLQSSWHFDDYCNIVSNERLHIDNLHPETLFESFFAKPWGGGDWLYRPLPMLTFAINWYLSNERTFGYHLVNLGFHVLTALILFLTVLRLYETPKLKGTENDSVFFTAFLAASLWALNPIQVQAVTYIVQRMAVMAAFFYTAGIFFYIGARNADAKKEIFSNCLYSAICFAAAVGSKENAVSFPLSIFLVEIIFFQDLEHPKTRRIVFAGLAAIVAASAISGILLLFGGDALGMLRGYGARSFSFLERVLAQPRVLILYLSQIFYPIPDRLSFVHDIELSTSLFHPWTTLPSILAVIGLLLLGAKVSKKMPFAGFSILFFFAAHAVESTILPLEIVFEHRNYLASLFLFVPVASAIHAGISRFARDKPIMGGAVFFFTVSLLVSFGLGTYTRNMAWKSEQTLWEDAMAKAPNSGRPCQCLAWYVFEPNGRYNEALVLAGKSLGLRNERPAAKVEALNNMGVIYAQHGHLEKASEFFRKAIELSPHALSPRYHLGMVLIESAKYEQAAIVLDVLGRRAGNDARFLNARSYVHVKMNEPAKAVALLRKGLQARKMEKNILINIGAALSGLGHGDRSLWFCEVADRLFPNDPDILCWLLFNRYRLGEVERGDAVLDSLVDLVGLDRIASFLESLPGSVRVLPPPLDDYSSEISRRILARSELAARSIDKLGIESRWTK